MLNQREAPCSALADLFSLLEPRSQRTTMAGKDHHTSTDPNSHPRWAQAYQHQVVPSFVHLSCKDRKSMSCFGNLFHQTTILSGENCFFLSDCSFLPSSCKSRLLPKRKKNFRQDSESLPGSTEESTEGKTGGKFTHRVGLEPILKKQPKTGTAGDSAVPATYLRHSLRV